MISYDGLSLFMSDTKTKKINKQTEQKPRDLLQLLYMNGRISSTLLGVIKAYRDEWKLSDYESAINVHVIEEPELADCLAKALNIPRLSGDLEVLVDMSLIVNLPYKVARAWAAIPYRDANSNEIYVAMADPTHEQAIVQLKTMLACEFKLAVAERQAILDTIDRIYPLVIFPNEIKCLE